MKYRLERCRGITFKNCQGQSQSSCDAVGAGLGRRRGGRGVYDVLSKKNPTDIRTVASTITKTLVMQFIHQLTSPIFIVIMSMTIGVAIGYCIRKVYAFQNRGELLVRNAIKKHFRPPDYHLLNHITLKHGSGTTQIDHILVSRFGIFVIE